MKILYFVLGDIYKRVLEGREESFKFFLNNNDIVFFGPIPYSSFSFNQKNFQIIQVNKSTTLADFKERIPNDWFPDIAVVETPVLNLIPDFYRIECKTLCYPRDSWADMIFNRNIFDFFDFNHYQTVDKFKYTLNNSSFIPLTGNPTSHLEYDKDILHFDKRKIDVLSIANLNDGFYHRRGVIFNKIARDLNKNFNILFTKGIPKSKINTYYERCKIVIDYSYVASNRAYEAIGNGCLFFSYEDNPLVKEVFVPNIEYVPYSFDNLIQKLEYYLNNPTEAQEIVTNGRKKLQHLPKHPGEANVKRIDYACKVNVDVNVRIKNIDNWTLTKYYHAIATPLYFNYNYPNKNIPENWQELYFERIEKSSQYAQNNEELIYPLIEAGRMAFLLQDFEKATFFLNKLIAVFPEFAWAYWLKARIHYNNKEFEKSITYAMKSIVLTEANPELHYKYILPFAENGNTADQRRIGEYLYEGIARDYDKEYQLKVCLHLNYELLGDILLKTNIEDAKKYYIKSTDILSIPTVFKKLSVIYLQQYEYDNLIYYSNKGLEDSPYENNLILLKAIGLLCSTSVSSKEYYQYLKDQNNVFSCYGGDKKIKLLRIIFSILLIFRFSKSIQKQFLLKVYYKI